MELPNKKMSATALSMPSLVTLVISGPFLEENVPFMIKKEKGRKKRREEKRREKKKKKNKRNK